MVEPRFIDAPFGGVYGSAKDCIQVRGLYAVGGKIHYIGEKLYYSRFILIVMGFQLSVMGRAKIMQGVECRIKLYVCYKFIRPTVFISREVDKGCKNILYGRTNHDYRWRTAWLWSQDHSWVINDL